MPPTLPGFAVLHGTPADVRTVFEHARRHFGRHPARPFALGVGRLTTIDALFFSAHRDGPRGWQTVAYDRRCAAFLRSLARALGRQLIVWWHHWHSPPRGAMSRDSGIELMAPTPTGCTWQKITLWRVESLLGVPYGAVANFESVLPIRQVLWLNRPYPRDQVTDWLSRPPSAPWRYTWGAILVPRSGVDVVQRVHAIVRSYLLARGDTLAGRTLRAATYRSLPLWSFDVPSAPSDFTPFKHPELPDADGARFVGTTFVDGAPDLLSLLVQSLHCEAWTWRRPAPPGHGAREWVRHASPAESAPPRVLAHGLHEIAQRFGVNDLALSVVQSSLALEIPLDAPVDEQAIVDYLARALPAATPRSFDEVDRNTRTLQHFLLEPWMVFEADTLARRFNCSLGKVFSLAWSLGSRHVWTRYRRPDGALADRPLPPGLRWSPTPTPPPTVTRQPAVTVALDVDWRIIDEGLALAARCHLPFLSLLGMAWLAARPTLWALDADRRSARNL